MNEKRLVQRFTLQHRIQIRVLLVESLKFYSWATALYS